MHPRADDALHRRGHIGHQSGDRVHVIVRPTAPNLHRNGHAGIILADGPMLPIGVAGLMARPARREPRLGLQPGQPIGPPVRPQRRIGGAAGIGQHHRPPAKILAQQATTLVMDVIGKAVGRGTDRDHGLQRGRLAEGGLQAVKPTPAFAHHPDSAAAPRLGGKPRDHLLGISQFLLGVLVVDQPFAVTTTAHVHPHGGIAVTGEIGVHHLVARQGSVALAVRDILQNRRDRIARRILWHPDPRRKAAAIRQHNAHIRRFQHLMRKIRANGHGSSPRSYEATEIRKTRHEFAASTDNCDTGALHDQKPACPPDQAAAPIGKPTARPR